MSDIIRAQTPEPYTGPVGPTGKATHVSVRDLSPALQSALKACGYGAADIQVFPAFAIESQVYASDGQRGFVTIVNLDTGARHSETGSWGGSNMHVRTRADDSPEAIVLPINGAVVKGSRGYPRTFATIYAHPDTFGRLLPSGDEEDLSEQAQQCLYCFAAIKGGEYRRDEMRRRNVSSEDVDALVSSGHLKRNKAGAVQITTKGKNARTVRN